MQPELNEGHASSLVVQAMADAAFLLTDAVTSPARWPGQVVVGAMPFHGAAKGHVVVATTPLCAAEIAASMLGLDPQAAQSPDRGPDAVAELSGMVAAAVLVSWLGEDAEWGLGDAEHEMSMPGDFDTRGEASAWRLHLETEGGHRIDVLLELQ